MTGNGLFLANHDCCFRSGTRQEKGTAGSTPRPSASRLPGRIPVSSEVLEKAAKRFAAEHKDKHPLFGRDLDALMRQSPHIFNLYVTLVYADITQPY